MEVNRDDLEIAVLDALSEYDVNPKDRGDITNAILDYIGLENEEDR